MGDLPGRTRDGIAESPQIHPHDITLGGEFRPDGIPHAAVGDTGVDEHDRQFATRPLAVISDAVDGIGSHGPPGRSDVPVTLRQGLASHNRICPWSWGCCRYRRTGREAELNIEPKPRTRKGPAEWFTGDVYIDASHVRKAEPSRMACGCVHFTPGARTAWHSHVVGQTLYITEGVALLGTRDGNVIVARPGASGAI
jgi:hypothetical protein